MNFSQHVKEEKIKARYNNLQEVRQNIKQPWVTQKINNYIEKWDGLFTYEQIEQEILTNDLVASMFCKDPGKQNISEKLAAEVLKLNRLAQQGKNSIRFTPTGEITSVSGNGVNTKAADFILNGYYATQKFTEGEGGAQDNQRNDVILFLTYGSISHKVAAIVDGDYWENKNIIYLRTLFKDNPNVLITSVTELTS
jgi:hypothetical protein